MAAVGAYLHRRDYIVGNGKRTLALISQQITIPAFLFTKIVYCNQDWSDQPCPDITGNLGDIWILLFWPAYVVSVGIGVGYIAARASNTPREQYRSVLAACAFGNSTGLPITLLTVIHANFSPTQELGAIDPTLFLSVYLLLYPVLQWSIGGWLLAPDINADQKSLKGASALSSRSLENGNGEIPQNVATTSPLPPVVESDPSAGAYETLRSSFTSPVTNNVLNNKSAQTFYKTLRRGISETDASLYISNADLVGLAAQHSEKEQTLMAETIAMAMPSSPVHPIPPPSNLSATGTNETEPMSSMALSAPSAQQKLPPIGEQTPLLNQAAAARTAVAEEDEESSSVGSDTAVTGITTHIDETSLWDTLSEILSRCLQPPVIAAVLGLVVASTSLRGIFVDLVNRADAAPLEWMFDGLYSVGQAAVPINMIILGCNLSASTLSSKGASNAHLLSNQTTAAIVIGKMVLMPLLGILSCWVLSLWWKMPHEIDEPFWLVCMIVFLTPTANNVMVMVELSGSGSKEGIAQVIGWQYAVAPVLLSLSVTATVGMAMFLNDK
jgi:predicted permease